MNAQQIRGRLDELASHLTFTYKGESCGIDPMNRTHFNMWSGENEMVAKSLDEVMESAFFDGKSLAEIAEQITITDW